MSEIGIAEFAALLRISGAEFSDHRQTCGATFPMPKITKNGQRWHVEQVAIHVARRFTIQQTHVAENLFLAVHRLAQTMRTERKIYVSKLELYGAITPESQKSQWLALHLEHLKSARNRLEQIKIDLAATHDFMQRAEERATPELSPDLLALLEQMREAVATQTADIQARTEELNGRYLNAVDYFVALNNKGWRFPEDGDETDFDEFDEDEDDIYEDDEYAQDDDEQELYEKEVAEFAEDCQAHAVHLAEHIADYDKQIAPVEKMLSRVESTRGKLRARFARLEQARHKTNKERYAGTLKPTNISVGDRLAYWLK